MRSALNPATMFLELLQHRYLLGQLVKRDVVLRYRGALFGVLWAFLNPLLMLAILAYVFGGIFKPSWPESHDSVPFWLMLYCGLISFNVFAESVSRSPSSVRESPSFVKKIVFPVSILPVVPVCAALVHAAFNLLVLAGFLAWSGHLSATLLLYPVTLLPLILLAQGLSWFLAAWGVFIKDMAQVIPVFVQISLFLSPVLYPASAIPTAFQHIHQYNPLSAVIEAGRAAAVGTSIPWESWSLALAIGLATMLLGHWFFQHSREEFADVL
jgi:lipopolysaccharide transport system permease protein